MKHRAQFLGLAAALLLPLVACGSPAPAVTASPTPYLPVAAATPAPTASSGPVSPLTGLPVPLAIDVQRPYAVMLNNIKGALPQQGNSQADIIYECLAEGGITRMIGLYQSMEGVGTVGSVRSARPYYLEIALGHDAIYLHAGGSDDAYAKIKSWGVTALDCVRGPYEGSLFWRDKDRIKNNGHTHSVVTSGDKVLELVPTYGLRLTHEDSFSYPQAFAVDGTPAGGVTANTVTVPFTDQKKDVFTYDAAQKSYRIEEYGKPYIDGNTGAQVSVTNVITVKTACNTIAGDDAGRITVDLTSGGAGTFASGGKMIDITWSKASRNAPFAYQTEDGQPLTLGVGKSYVCVVPTNAAVTAE